MSKKLNVKGADRRLKSLFDFFGYYLPINLRAIWADRIRKAASQPGFKFDPALRRFLVYVLVGSKKYSLLTSVKKAEDYRSKEVARLIIRVARMISRGASYDELKPAFDIAYNDLADDDVRAGLTIAAACAAAVDASDTSQDFVEGAMGNAAHAARKASKSKSDGNEFLESSEDYAAALLYFVEQEAYGQGKRRGNPSTEKVPSLEKLLGTRRTSRNSAPRSANPKAAKKTTRKAPLAKTLISKCQKTWDHYCAKPSKKRLEEVFDHLETMKESSAKTVKEERSRCLRVANKEARRLGMKK